jgi:low temperature requirement protein LtrA
MVAPGGEPTLFRARPPHGQHRVTSVELFFDLVFVFAVTQLSHGLLGRFTRLGLIETAMLMLAVWWVWIYTSWITNWLDPDRPPVKLMMLALMLIGLAMSTSIPQAFGSRGLTFGASYATMQVGRTVFMLAAIPRADAVLLRNFQRVLVWLVTSGCFWIAGGLVGGSARIDLWGLALLIEYAGPAARFWTPGMGASRVQDWAIEGGHLAERAGQFIIIALGESILVTGMTFSRAVWSPASLGAFVAAFTASVAMWWIYFDRGADLGVERITSAANPGRLGRLAYTYLHLPIVAGIILFAVGHELTLAHPEGHTDTKTALGVLGGAAVYLGGQLLFKRVLRGRLQPSHLVALALLVGLCFVAAHVSPPWLEVANALVLVIVAVWEVVSRRGA